MGALLTIGAHLALLILVFIPIAKVESIFIPWLVCGGLAGAWLVHVGKARREVTTTLAKPLDLADRKALWTRFPWSLRLLNASGFVLIFGLAIFEIALWLHGTSRANIRQATIPTSMVVGVVLGWIGIALMHWRVTGGAMWLVAAGVLRWHETLANRRCDPLPTAPLFVHGWRRTEIHTSLPLTPCRAHGHVLVDATPLPTVETTHTYDLYTFGNFLGDHAAELCLQQLKPDQKAALARELEALMADLLTQAPVGKEAAVTQLPSDGDTGPDSLRSSLKPAA